MAKTKTTGEEIWKDVPEYPNYEVSNTGHIRNKSRNTLLRGSKVPGTHYIRVALSKQGIPTYTVLHRVVARVFLKNFDERRRVELIDVNGGCGVSNLVMAPQGCNTPYYPWGDISADYRRKASGY